MSYLQYWSLGRDAVRPGQPPVILDRLAGVLQQMDLLRF